MALKLLIFISSFFICQVGLASSAPEEIYAALDRWKMAWSELDTDGYISSYSPNFIGQSYATRQSWVNAREQRFESQKWIELKLTGIVIFIRNDGKYAGNFTQQYRSDSFFETSRKQLLFEKHPNGWLIVSESEINNY